MKRREFLGAAAAAMIAGHLPQCEAGQRVALTCIEVKPSKYTWWLCSWDGEKFIPIKEFEPGMRGHYMVDEGHAWVMGEANMIKKELRDTK